MPSIFLSYRREDSRHQTGRLHDRLVAHFGPAQVFKDVDSIPLGRDFREILTERVVACDVFIAVIGDGWLSVAGQSRARRLDDPGDFVRIEIEAALCRRIPVIPVLVGNSSVPRAEELPESLRELSFRHGLAVRPDPDFHKDMDRLIRGIEEGLAAPRRRSTPGGPRIQNPEARKPARHAPVPTPEPVASPAPSREGRRTRRPWIVGATMLGVLLLGVIVYVATDKGRIKIEVNDPNAVVKIDQGPEVRIEGLGEPLTLRTGDHVLSVKRGDVEFETQKFIIRRGDNPALSVEFKPKKSAPASIVEAPVTNPTPPPPIAEKIAVKPDDTLITNTIGIKLRRIPAGTFFMGSRDGDAQAYDNERPGHEVRLGAFYLGETEVTQGQYRAVTGESPSHFKGSDDLPVETVSWLDAVRFCNALSQKEGLRPYYRIEGNDVSVPDWKGAGYRLPTEAEWEYACRAGLGGAGAFCFGDAAGQLGRYGWYRSNSDVKTHPVGQKLANAFGLYDMHGNVWEWCWDWFADYDVKPTVNPVGPLGAADRVLRGGSWYDAPRDCRSGSRSWRTPDYRRNLLGFRVLRVRWGL